MAKRREAGAARPEGAAEAVELPEPDALEKCLGRERGRAWMPATLFLLASRKFVIGMDAALPAGAVFFVA